MSLKSVVQVAVPAVLAAFALAAAAQQPNPMDVVPDKMPNDIPYGAPIALDHAQAAGARTSPPRTGLSGR